MNQTKLLEEALVKCVALAADANLPKLARAELLGVAARLLTIQHHQETRRGRARCDA